MMVGRDRELKTLTKLAASDQPKVALIAGEPGIGKTRLINELLTTLPPEHVVLVGHAEPGSLSRPYEVLLDALHGIPDRPRPKKRRTHRYTVMRQRGCQARRAAPLHPARTGRSADTGAPPARSPEVGTGTRQPLAGQTGHPVRTGLSRQLSNGRPASLSPGLMGYSAWLFGVGDEAEYGNADDVARAPCPIPAH